MSCKFHIGNYCINKQGWIIKILDVSTHYYRYIGINRDKYKQKTFRIWIEDEFKLLDDKTLKLELL